MAGYSLASAERDSRLMADIAQFVLKRYFGAIAPALQVPVSAPYPITEVLPTFELAGGSS